MAYATVEDVEGRWHSLTSDEQERCALMLSDAAVAIDMLTTVGESKLEAAKIVSCNMVIRSMAASDSQNDNDAFGATSVTTTAGPYSQSVSFANPSGDLYFTKLDKKMLGIRGGGRMLRPTIGLEAS